MSVKYAFYRHERAIARYISTVNFFHQSRKIMKLFREIDQLYHLFRRMKSWADYNQVPYAELGTADFEGTVKLHGTNGGIVIAGAGERPTAQSKTRELQVTADNHGFAFFLETVPQHVIDDLYVQLNPKGEGVLTVFGEWCGGNIQGGVALNQTPKHFVMFAAHVDDEYVVFNYDVKHNDVGIYNIGQIPRHSISIDFAAEDQSQLETHLSELVAQTEAECPWAKQVWNVSGIGEGLVWHRKDRPWDSNFYFKTKGEKHSVRKNKTKNLVSADPEKVANIQECVDIILTENRMLQMIERDQLAYEHKSIGPFLQAVCKDCAKEEMTVIVENGLEWKDVAKVIQFRARNWFLEKLGKL